MINTLYLLSILLWYRERASKYGDSSYVILRYQNTKRIKPKKKDSMDDTLTRDYMSMS